VPSTRHTVAAIAAAGALLLSACSSGSGDDSSSTASDPITDTTAETDAPIPEAASLPAPDATLCVAVNDLAAADVTLEGLLEQGRSNGTTGSIVASSAYGEATAALGAASAAYVAIAPPEVVALAQEKESLDDAVGKQLLTAGELDDDGRAWLERAAALDAVVSQYSEIHCEVAASPS